MLFLYIIICSVVRNTCSLSVCCRVIIDSFKTQWNKEVDLALDLSLNNDAYEQRGLSIIV